VIMSKRWGAIALLAVLGALAIPSAANASQGSVPAEVSAYAADPGGLISRLDDLFGPSASGNGIEFGETTTVGQLNRVFTFTPAFIADDSTDTPVERLNEWSAPILIDEEPVGLATIWINPATVAPELADFEPVPELATALTDVPAEVYVVHDTSRAAWFTLVDTTLTTLAAGSSGAATEVSLADYQQVLADAAEAAAAAEPPVNTGAILSIAIIAAAALAVILVLLIPLIRGRSRGEAAESQAPMTPAEAVTSEPGKVLVAALAAPVVDASAGEPAAEPAAAERAATKSAAAKPAAAKSGAAKTPRATAQAAKSDAAKSGAAKSEAAKTPSTTAKSKPAASRTAASRAPEPPVDAD
jgi:hypothetical protein